MTDKEKLEIAEGHLRQVPALWYTYEAQTRQPFDFKGLGIAILFCLVTFFLVSLYGTSGKTESPSVISKPSTFIEP